MRTWIAFWSIFAKDLRAYYLKPPNISWGLLFPLAWTGMLLIRSGGGTEHVRELLPGLMSISILFGTTSLLAVTVTFERRGRSFERLLLAPLSLELLVLAKTLGAILFGLANAFVPMALAALLTDLHDVAWPAVVAASALLAAAATFLGLLIAVSVTEVFEAQMLANLFRFPMLFLCGLFFPIADLPALLRPLAYALPVTYGVDALRGAVRTGPTLPAGLDFLMLALFSLGLFAVSLWNVRRRWIL